MSETLSARDRLKAKKKAKANGVYSKVRKINPDKIRELRSECIGATEICRRLRCSRTSVYNALKEVV